jgi:hypothetical protein
MFQFPPGKEYDREEGGIRYLQLNIQVITTVVKFNSGI